MKVSVCLTVFNEEKSISKLLGSLLNQSQKPNEIVIVDGGSTDQTVEIIRHLQKKNKLIKLLIEKCNRAKGRNLSVELAKNEIIVTTDGDCIAEKIWLQKLTEPFKHKDIDISAGFYAMKSENDFQKAESFFLGVMPSKFDENFLPSTRSMAFRKKAWEEIGGFPESDDNSAEDTDFNYKAVNLGIKFARVKEAIVEWDTPKTYKEFVEKIYNYAKWDAKYGIWWHPLKRFESHNIKAVFKILRYLLGFAFFILAFFNPFFWLVLFLSLLVYIFWSFRKVYEEFREFKVALWGIVLQLTTDFAVITGFLKGLLN